MSPRDDLPREKHRRLPHLRSGKLHRAEQPGEEHPGEEHPRLDGRARTGRERLKVLFVCSRNQWRSPTAERVFRRHPLMAVRSVGTSPNARRTIGEADLRWADVVMVMESGHRDRIRAAFPRLAEHPQIHVLEIPDDYRFMDPELVEILEEVMPALLFD